MRNVRSILGIGIMSIFFITGCLQPMVSRSYTNEIYGFSLNPPAGWQQVDNALPNVAVWFAPENFTNISFIIGVPFSLSEGRALSTFADQVEENLSDSGMNYTILYRDWRPVPDVQSYEIAYSYERDGALEFTKQVAVLKTRTVFLITFTAPIELSTSYLTDVNQSIDSFM
ncbi:MAG TPA: DcrB-related protein [Candidatus Thermoplasmatota archaeon]|nr:DcrB-related protein [Candidatus Thermoplasmatota archaeon]